MRKVSCASAVVFMLFTGCKTGVTPTHPVLPDLRFNRTGWLKNPDNASEQTVRSRMARDLLAHKLPTVRSGRQVRDLLGDPTFKTDPVTLEGFERSPDGGVAWVYDVASFEDDGDAMAEAVVVLVDKKGSVLKSREVFRN